MKYLYCYDIAHPKRLNLVAKYLEKEGLRIQKSFFLCDLDYSEAKLLLIQLQKFLNLRYDSIFMYGICERCLKRTFKVGNGAFTLMQEYKIL